MGMCVGVGRYHSWSGLGLNVSTQETYGVAVEPCK